MKFKLASNTALAEFLKKRADEEAEAQAKNQEMNPSVLVVFHFTDVERERAEGYLREITLTSHHVVMIDASTPKASDDMAEQPERHSKVFISYSHDCDAWAKQGKDPQTQRKRVFDLAEHLRQGGIDCVIDQHIANPPNNSWPRWMMDRIEEADFVLVVATEPHNRRFRGKEDPGKGLGAQWEGAIITQEIYKASGGEHKFVPIVFENSDADHVPLPLRGATRYNVSNPSDFDELCYYLTHQPPYTPIPLGPMKKRPPRGS